MDPVFILLFIRLSYKKNSLTRPSLQLCNSLYSILVCFFFVFSPNILQVIKVLSWVYLSMAGEVNGAIYPWKEKSTGLFAHEKKSQRISVRGWMSVFLYIVLLIFVYVSCFEWLERERLTTRGCRGRIKSWSDLLICLYKQLRFLCVGVYREISVAVINRSYRSILCWCWWFKEVDKRLPGVCRLWLRATLWFQDCG